MVYVRGDIIRVYVSGDIIRVYVRGDIIRVYVRGDIIRVYVRGDIIIMSSFLRCTRSDCPYLHTAPKKKVLQSPKCECCQMKRK